VSEPVGRKREGGGVGCVYSYDRPQERERSGSFVVKYIYPAK
jgi:hypothetical protein